MPGVIVGRKMNYGGVGLWAKHGDRLSSAHILNVDSDAVEVGNALVRNADGTFSKWAATNTAADFNGVVEHRAKQNTTWPDNGNMVVLPGEMVDCFQRGSITVYCVDGSPEFGGAVYIRTAVVDGTSPEGVEIGDFGANNEAGNVIQLTNAKWGGVKDANDVAELVLLTRQGV